MEWSFTLKEAFYSTKVLIVYISKLFFYTEDAPIFVLTDVSDYEIGSYFYQLVDGKEQPVAFVSKSLTGPQLKSSNIQKEADTKFNYCITKLEDRTFCLMTDHANLVYFNKSTNMMESRWKTAFGSYDFVVKHIQCVKSIVADYFIRLVKNHMLDEVAKAPDLDDKLKEESIISLLHHNEMISDEA